MEFRDFFIKGAHNTLRLRNNTQFAYKNHWKSLHSNIVLDKWHIGEIMSANYTIIADNGRNDKETIQVLAIAGPDDAAITITGRAGLSTDILTLSANVDKSSFELIVSPAAAGKEGARVMYTATYFQTLSD